MTSDNNVNKSTYQKQLVKRLTLYAAEKNLTAEMRKIFNEKIQDDLELQENLKKLSECLVSEIKSEPDLDYEFSIRQKLQASQCKINPEMYKNLVENWKSMLYISDKIQLKKEIQN